MVIINHRGFWEGSDAEAAHAFDPALCASLCSFFARERASTLVDLGCGMGLYVRELRSAGLTVDGFDGNPDTPELTENACGVLDLSEPVSFEKPYDWVMSLEVGEHLPPQFEDIYIANLHNSNVSGIVLSWALKGQGGFGHFNERDNEYIKARFAELGYTNDIENENILRESSTLPYFKRTIMVFRKA